MVEGGISVLEGKKERKKERKNHGAITTAKSPKKKAVTRVSVPPSSLPASHQRARSHGPTSATDRLASSVARRRSVDVAVAPVEVETASFSLELVVLAGG